MSRATILGRLEPIGVAVVALESGAVALVHHYGGFSRDQIIEVEPIEGGGWRLLPESPESPGGDPEEKPEAPPETRACPVCYQTRPAWKSTYACPVCCGRYNEANGIGYDSDHDVEPPGDPPGGQQ